MEAWVRERVEMGESAHFPVAFRQMLVVAVKASELTKSLFPMHAPQNQTFHNQTNRIQQEQLYNTAYEFKLRGNPFFSDGSEAVLSRMLLSQILANFRAQGYKLYTSIDISIGNEGMDVESWVFRRVGPAWF